MSDLVGSYVDRFGNTVVLTGRQWREHLLPKHREMEPLLWCFPRVLSSPSGVTRDTAVSTTRCYYLRGIVPQRVVKIVVDFPPDDPTAPLFSSVVGIILTAFLAVGVKTKEQRLWP